MSVSSIVNELAAILQQRGEMLTTAESCTGGGVAQALTDKAGSSLWFERGFVTYSNEAKHEMLGVDCNIIQQYGAVSEETARAMATGAVNHSQASISLATTGIAGPDGGSVEKPVGTVWFAWWFEKTCMTQHHVFNGDRHAIREQAIEYALGQLTKLLRG